MSNRADYLQREFERVVRETVKAKVEAVITKMNYAVGERMKQADARANSEMRSYFYKLYWKTGTQAELDGHLNKALIQIGVTEEQKAIIAWNDSSRAGLTYFDPLTDKLPQSCLDLDRMVQTARSLGRSGKKK